MLKGYYLRANHCFISRSTGDLEYYPAGHWRVCRSLQHACEWKGKLNSKDTLCPAHRSYVACEALRDGARMQRVSRVGKDNMHKEVWIWFMPSIPSHRKPLTIFLTYLAFSCIFVFAPPVFSASAWASVHPNTSTSSTSFSISFRLLLLDEGFTEDHLAGPTHRHSMRI